MARPFKNHHNHAELAAFGSAVRTLRRQKNISQEVLADMAGIDRSYMGGIERGEHNVALINMKKIADSLGVSLAELMEGAEL